MKLAFKFELSLEISNSFPEKSFATLAAAASEYGRPFPLPIVGFRLSDL